MAAQEQRLLTDSQIEQAVDGHTSYSAEQPGLHRRPQWLIQILRAQCAAGVAETEARWKKQASKMANEYFDKRHYAEAIGIGNLLTALGASEEVKDA